MLESESEPEMLELNDKFAIASYVSLFDSEENSDPVGRTAALSETWQGTVLPGQVDIQRRYFTARFSLVDAQTPLEYPEPDGDPYLGHLGADIFGRRAESQITSVSFSHILTDEFGLLNIKPIPTSVSLNPPTTNEYITAEEKSVLRPVSSWQSPLNTLSLASKRIGAVSLCDPSSICIGNGAAIDYTINQVINPSIVAGPKDVFQSNVIPANTVQLSSVINPFEIHSTVIVIVDAKQEKKRSRNKYSELLAKNLDHNSKIPTHPAAKYNRGSSTSSNVGFHTAAKCLKC